MSSLQTFPNFTENPGRALGAAFLEHVRTTGEPETFEGLSTTRPPDTGELVVLAYPVTVDRERRPEGRSIPCPICSPTAGKFLEKGTLIWCGDTAAIYLVGPTCSTTGWMSKLSAAQNAFTEEEEARANAAGLSAAAAAAPAQVLWADHVAATVANAERLQHELDRSLPLVRRMISDAYKQSTGGWITVRTSSGANSTVGRLRGGAFFGGRWRLTHRLAEAKKTLERLISDGGSDAETWATSLTPSLRKSRLKEARAAVDELEEVRSSVEAASRALSPDGLDVLAGWIQGGGGPSGARMSRTALELDIQHEGGRWRARARSISPLPDMPQEP